MAGLLFVVMSTRSVTLIVLVLLAALACGPKPPSISLVEAVTLGKVDAVQRHMEIGTDPNESFVPPGRGWRRGVGTAFGGCLE